LPGQDVSFVRTISTNPQFPGYNAVAVFESYNTPADGIGWLANTTPNNLDYPSTTSSYYSVALVSTSPVPLPAAAWLLLTGLGGLGAFAKRPKALLA
jgi:hypothetical protein